MSEMQYTKDEAVAFIQAMRLAVTGKVGFKWMVDKLAQLSAYIEATADENRRLNDYLDQANARSDYEAYLAALGSDRTARPKE